MSLLPLLVIGFLGWGAVSWWMSKPSVPAWRSRNAFQACNLLLWLLLLVMGWKATQWHTELITLLPYCH